MLFEPSNLYFAHILCYNYDTKLSGQVWTSDSNLWDFNNIHLVTSSWEFRRHFVPDYPIQSSGTPTPRRSHLPNWLNGSTILLLIFWSPAYLALSFAQSVITHCFWERCGTHCRSSAVNRFAGFCSCVSCCYADPAAAAKLSFAHQAAGHTARCMLEFFPLMNSPNFEGICRIHQGIKNTKHLPISVIQCIMYD